MASQVVLRAAEALLCHRGYTEADAMVVEAGGVSCGSEARPLETWSCGRNCTQDDPPAPAGRAADQPRRPLAPSTTPDG